MLYLRKETTELRASIEESAQHALSILLTVPDSVTQQVISTILDTRPSHEHVSETVYGPTVSANSREDVIWQSEIKNREAALIVGPATCYRAIPLTTLLNVCPRWAKPRTIWFLYILFVLLSAVMTLEGRIFRPDGAGSENTPVLGSIVMLIGLAACFLTAHHVNTWLLKRFICRFDFIMITVSVLRAFAGWCINDFESPTLHANTYTFLRQVGYLCFGLFALASLDAALHGNRKVKKIFLVSALSCAVALWFILTFYYKGWAVDAEDVPLWFVLMKPKQQFLSGVSTICIFLGKFTYRVALLDQDFAAFNARLQILSVVCYDAAPHAGETELQAKQSNGDLHAMDRVFVQR